jgi:hypothetical protein
MPSRELDLLRKIPKETSKRGSGFVEGMIILRTFFTYLPLFILPGFIAYPCPHRYANIDSLHPESLSHPQPPMHRDAPSFQPVIEVALKPRPSLVANFVGREDILEAMRQTHLTRRSTNSKSPEITVLSGLGGAGKTQTALKFALEFEEK